MKTFAYVNPANVQEAVAALDPERGRVLPLAGGMDLVALMKDYIATPDRVVNVKRLDAAIGDAPDGGLRIGAAARLVDVETHARVAKEYRALAQAAGEVGTPQIRNLGTVGGNLLQRPRCWYFRNEEFPCLKKGGARCYSVDGENQFHAIIGGGPCAWNSGCYCYYGGAARSDGLEPLPPGSGRSGGGSGCCCGGGGCGPNGPTRT